MKSRAGQRQREKRKIRREKSRRERVRRKKMQMREKVGKSRNTVFFQFVAPEGRKVGSLKRRVQSQLARWEMKKCTPLWREAHFEVKMYKTPQCRTTFGNSQQPTSPIGFLFLKLPPPPCAVLLVNQQSASLVHLESQVCCQTKHPNDIELRQVWNSCACWNLESLKASCSNVCFLWFVLRFFHMVPHFWALSEQFPNNLF